MIPDDIRALAEEQGLPDICWPGSEYIVDPRFWIWIAPSMYPDLSVIRHCRFSTEDVVSVVNCVRELLLARGRRRAIWNVAASAIPDGLADELATLGLEWDSDPVLKAIVLRTALPDSDDDGIVVRRAKTRADFERFYRIQQEAFEIDPDTIERGAAGLDDVYEAERSADHIATYLAYIDGEPVATARATFTPIGVVLNGGSTLHRARGRGAYRALVAARWKDAVAHATPVLTTLARPSSYPILKRLGFEDVSDVKSLVDTF